MSDYISRNDARKALCGMCHHDLTGNCEECEHPINDIPAADVAPVVYGSWIKVDDGVYYHMECSLCHERPLRNRWVDDIEFSPYCPNCGANMKDGDEE